MCNNFNYYFNAMKTYRELIVWGLFALFNIARSSTHELETLLEIGHNLNYITADSFSDFFEKSKEIECMLSVLIAKINQGCDITA